MKSVIYLLVGFTLVLVGGGTWMVAQDSPRPANHVPPLKVLRGGYQFLTTKVYSKDDDALLLEEFAGLRVADVSDGMDAIGLPNAGLLDPEIAPLWVNSEDYGHRFLGIAVTVRFVPKRAVQMERDESEFEKFVADWHENKAADPFIHILRPGSVMIIDDAARNESGTVNANNVLSWFTRGCVGVVTSGGVRDSDEILSQRMPVYHRKQGRGIRAGRVELESVNRPVVLGGVCIMPGDVIVADGDGVAVVPRMHAERVARYAQRIRAQDLENRRELYEQLARPADVSFR